jgi:hypothetical protein
MQTENMKIIWKSFLLNFLLVCNDTKSEVIFKLHFHREKIPQKSCHDILLFNLDRYNLQYSVVDNKYNCAVVSNIIVSSNSYI